MTTSAAEWQRHARTYHGFTLAVKWFCIHLATLITLLVVWFATPAGFVGAVVTAAIVYAVAIWAMNRFLAHSTENDNGELAEVTEAEHQSGG
jgi:membrane protein implicated in regulation of membrane protease activity